MNRRVARDTLKPAGAVVKRTASDTKPPAVSGKITKPATVATKPAASAAKSAASAAKPAVTEPVARPLPTFDTIFDDDDIVSDNTDYSDDIDEYNTSADNIAAEIDAEAIAAAAADVETSEPVTAKKKPSAAAKSGRGPGRPRKTDVSSNVQIDGILQEPAEPTDVLELLYHGPCLLKKIFMSLKGYEVTEVTLIFDKDGLQILTDCRMKKNNIQYRVNGNCILAYYCKEPIRVTARLEDINAAMSLVTKSYNRTMFFMKETTKNELHIVNKNESAGIEVKNKVSVSTVTAQQQQQKLDTCEGYPVSFVYDAAEFKRIIGVVSKSATTIKFSIEGSSDITMDIAVKNGGSSPALTLNKSKFHLTSTLEEGDIVVAAISNDSAKKYVDHYIGKEITIHMRSGEKVCFESCDDRRGDGYAITMQVFMRNQVAV